VVVIDPDAPLPTSFLPWGEVERAAAELPAAGAPTLTPEHEAAIIYTSGTTGRPKGVVLTHGNYAWDAEAIARCSEMSPEDRFLCVLPLFHVNAQVVTTMAPMVAGGSMILLERFSPGPFLDALGRFQATAFSAVPTVYAILNSLAEEQVRDLSRLRVCICGAAPMPVEVFETFERKYRARILEGYGLSEGTCASSVNPLRGRRKIGSVGVPLPGQEMRIVDDTGRPLENGRVGEIVVRGPNVMKGYFRNPAATAETIRDGWLHTGDLGTRDDDGYFAIVGRKKEMIIRGGENVYPREVEEALHRLPGVRECAVVGVPDPTWGEEVVAAIVPERPGAVDEGSIRAHCRQWLADYKAPRRVVFVDSLPRTATGKVQKHELVKALTGSGTK
jgi:long-chain acyl-CoA synthetase